MAAKEVIEIAGAVLGKLVENDSFKSTMLGEYTDGTPRSLPDAIGGEIYSPKQKKKSDKVKDKMKKKKKKKVKKSEFRL